MNNAQGECSKEKKKKQQPHEELLFNYYEGNCQMRKPKIKRKMRIHQSICYCKLVHATLSLKFGDSLKLSFFFEAFPSVFARTLACSFIHSLQLGFRLACSCGGCGCVCVYMVNVENGNIFSLCRFFYHFSFNFDLTTKRPSYRNCIYMYLKVADADRHHVMYAFIVQQHQSYNFQNSNEC